jgi:NADPH:quinone reductase-like Zn-dependent oxidoreductase
MRTVRYHAFGKPADVLQIDDVPAPEPGPSEVRVRLTHRSINPADLHTVLGRYGHLPHLPAVGGHEGVGYVDLIGDEVGDIKSGQRVIPLGIEGTWQEQLVAAPDDLFAVPDTVPDEAAAQLFVNPLTAWWMLEQLDLSEGDWLLQTGATSQVGRLVIQLARRRGVRTVNLVRREDAHDELTALGADEVVVTEADDDAPFVRKQILGLTDGGADGAVDCIAGAVGTLAANCLGEGATMLVYGGLSGEPLALDAGPLIFRRAAVRGFWRTRRFELLPRDETRIALTQLALLIADGDLVLPVEATYDLADVHEAVAHSRASGRSGKVLLTG